MLIQTLTDTEFRAEYLKAWSEYKMSCNRAREAMLNKEDRVMLVDFVKDMKVKEEMLNVFSSEAERRKVF